MIHRANDHLPIEDGSDILRDKLKPIPILIVGMNRSGTKWLSNLLCQHPSIAGVQSHVHTGIIETNMFRQIPNAFGEITDFEKYAAVIEFWSCTDFFKASGVPKSELYNLDPYPTNYLDIFAALMEHLAARTGASYWLQKISPLDAPAIIRHFDNARVIVISRAARRNIESSVQLARNAGQRASVVRAAALYAVQSKALRIIGGYPKAVSVDFESLRKDTEGTVRMLCQHLEVAYHDKMLQTPFRKNTSFEGTRTRENALSNSEWIIAQLIVLVAKFIPLRLLLGFRWFLRNRNAQFVRGTFSEAITTSKR